MQTADPSLTAAITIANPAAAEEPQLLLSTLVACARAFDALGLTQEGAPLLSFEELQVSLKGGALQSAARGLFEGLFALAVRRHGNALSVVGPTTARDTRVLLSMFSVVYHAPMVFATVGALEQRLINASAPLLRVFESLWTALLLPMPSLNVVVTVNTTNEEEDSVAAERLLLPLLLTLELLPLLHEYQRAFAEWQAPDEALMVHQIHHALVDLYQALARLPEDEAPGSPLNVELGVSINRLRLNLARLPGGEAILASIDAQLAAPGGGGGDEVWRTLVEGEGGASDDDDDNNNNIDNNNDDAS
jgi:hypothetical protein